MDGKEEFNRKSYYSNRWFWISVGITILLIALLVWNLINSYSTIKRFEKKEFKLQKASSELLYHITSMEMSTRLAVATGDLRLKRRYREHRPKLNNLLGKINSLVEDKKIENEVEKIRNYRDKTYSIENKVFKVISYGNKEKATELLKGWTYTKNQLRLKESTRKLSKYLSRHIRDIVRNEKKVTLVSLIFVLVSFVVLFISWYISIRVWKINFQKRKEKEEKIIYLNYHDSLTGVYNRRYFMQAGDDEMIRAERYDQNFSLIMFDVDHFKKVNDNYGHAAGDKVLKKLADVVKSEIREIDVLARIGGEEFSILLPGTDLDGALEAAERIRKNIEKKVVRIDNKKIPLTISMGVTAYRDSIKNFESLLKIADEALYEAKEDGRNCVVKTDPDK